MDVSFFGYPQGTKEVRADDTLIHVYIVVLSEEVDNQREPQSVKVRAEIEPLRWNESSSNIEACPQLKPGLNVGTAENTTA